MLLADLRDKYEESSGEIVHNVPYTPEQIAVQNVQRGACLVMEDLLGLEDEYRKWKAENK